MRKIQGLTEIVVRMRSVLCGRIGTISAHDFERPSPEMVRDDPDQRDQARIRRMGRAALPHQALERLQRRRRNAIVRTAHLDSENLRPSASRGRCLLRPDRGTPEAPHPTGASSSKERPRASSPVPSEWSPFASMRGNPPRNDQLLTRLEERVLEVVGSLDGLDGDVIALGDGVNRVAPLHDVRHVGG